MNIKKYRRVEIIYVKDGKEHYICPHAAITIIPRVGEVIWMSGMLHDEVVKKGLPSAYKVSEVCYHITELFGDIESYDSIVIYVEDF